MEFIGREKEFKYLSNIVKSKQSELIVVYGRRRLGKTRLLKEVIKTEDNSIYYLCVQESLKKNLVYFKELLAINLNNPLISQINTDSFVEFFRLIVDLIPQNYIIIFDEFPYLILQDKSIVSVFQKIYDEYFKPKNIKLVLCGSSSSIMGDLMSYQSPLYGRRTGVVNLQEFSFYETSLFLQNIKKLEDVAKYYMIFGGIPYYLEQINQNKSFDSNFYDLFFSGQSLFLDEVNFLLKEEFREVRNYLSIFKAISKGKNKFSEISEDTFIEKGSLSKYLTNLEVLNLIKNVRSFFDKQNSKKTIYTINDNFIHFWFSVIHKYLSQLENKSIQKQILKIDLPRVFGFLFERMCIRILNSKFERVGTYFRNVEIDILGQNDKNITCFECKFKSNINEKKIISDLKNKFAVLPEEFNYNAKLISINSDINLNKLLDMSK